MNFSVLKDNFKVLLIKTNITKSAQLHLVVTISTTKGSAVKIKKINNKKVIYKSFVFFLFCHD